MNGFRNAVLPIKASANAPFRSMFLMNRPFHPLLRREGAFPPAGNACFARSGFISRNNDDPTAEATFDFLQEARLKPSQFLIWNTVPWWNDTRKLTAAEIKAGLECLEALLKLLSRVRVVTLVGKHAQQVASDLKGIKVMTGKKVFESFHPSPLVRANHPDKWLSIPEVWKQARKYIGN